MRLTTKIVLGFILLVFILSLGFIIGFSFTGNGNYNKYKATPMISQDNLTEISVKPYKTICIERNDMEEYSWVFIEHPDKNKRKAVRINKKEMQDDKFNLMPKGKLLVTAPNEDKNESSFFMPKALIEFTEVISQNDTLLVLINMDKLADRYRGAANKKRFLFTLIEGFNFYAYTNSVDIINSDNFLSSISIDVKDITSKHIKVDAFSDINIDNCSAEVINPMGLNGRCVIKNCRAEELNIDLDNMASSWSVEDCKIEVENLTGSHKKSVWARKGNFKVMNWKPKTKDSELTITLHSDTARIVFL
ncbi:MAG: hypothetical protein BGO29_06905 [Bacteroidales bacterium 36-12]|nr:MAG: hypothetical protein BGO29_06905 [Bacteroidales bacterium 36-12]